MKTANTDRFSGAGRLIPALMTSLSVFVYLLLIFHPLFHSLGHHSGPGTGAKVNTPLFSGQAGRASCNGPCCSRHWLDSASNTGSIDNVDNIDSIDKTANPGKPETAEKSEESEKSEKSEKPERASTTGKQGFGPGHRHGRRQSQIQGAPCPICSFLILSGKSVFTSTVLLCQEQKLRLYTASRYSGWQYVKIFHNYGRAPPFSPLFTS